MSSYYYYSFLFIYLWIIIITIGKTLTYVLRHERGIFSSIGKEIPTQIKFPPPPVKSF